MKLNASEFRKNLEEIKKQKQQSEDSFLQTQLDLEASVSSRNQYMTMLCSIALDAALNGQQEIRLDEAAPTEFVDYLEKLGFKVDVREIEASSLLRKVREISPKDLKALDSRLRGELSKMIKVAAPQEGTDLLDAYVEYTNVDDALDIQVKHLLKVVSLYNTEYHENNDLSLEADAKLWLYLSRLKDVINFYDPVNDTSEECSLPFLSWTNEYIEIVELPADDASHSMLNPRKLRFINSILGTELFEKISDFMTSQTEALQSFIQFDFFLDTDNGVILFSDESTHVIPFSPLDLQLIFQKMGFKVSFKHRSSRRTAEAFAFKVEF